MTHTGAHRFLPIVAFILAASAGTALCQTAASGGLPEIKKNCSTCHVDISKGPALNKALSGLCLDCHSDRKSSSEHKVDIVPPMKVQNLPLFEGKMTCATCHDPHENKYDSMLRMKGKILCLQCHPF